MDVDSWERESQAGDLQGSVRKSAIRVTRLLTTWEQIQS